MISIIFDTIRKEFPDLAGGPEAPLSAFKYSTPSSGTFLTDKVLFFIFRQGEPIPFVCAKTVRSYGARDAIVQAFNNVKQLNDFTEGTPYEHFFVKALHLYDDGEQVFSLEEACPYDRIVLDDNSMRAVVEEYTGCQEMLAKRKGKQEGRDVMAFIKEVVEQSEWPKHNQRVLLHFIERLPLNDVKLPRLIQHGDLTEDNILKTPSGFCAIDCDYTGVIDLPGFDLFSLFYRFDPLKSRKLAYQYLPDYFTRIGVSVGRRSIDGLLFVYYLLERTLRKRYLARTMSAERLIVKFENVCIKCVAA